MAKNLVIILAGGAGKRLLLLSEYRAKPAVPFGGIYRIIDFALSNCINSGLYNVFVLSQYRPRSLWRHLQFGNPWGLNRLDGELVILQPHVGNVESKWYEGNADAVHQNLRFLQERTPETVLILAGDHVYKMDYRPLLEFHRRRNADLTVAVKRVKPEETSKFGTCLLDDNKAIVEFEEKAASARSNLASMGIYAFDAKVLYDCLDKDARASKSSHDFGRDIVPTLLEDHRVFGYEFRGYWQDVGTVGSYFETSMALLHSRPPFELSDPDWPILTAFEDRSPAAFLSTADVETTLACDGCVIDGTVESSIISPGVIVETGAVVRNSIVLHQSVVSRGAKVSLAIIDKETVVGRDAKVGSGVDLTPNSDHPDIMNNGVTLIGKGTYIPAGSIIGRNCLLHTRVTADGPIILASGRSMV
jgi:glucose-1-phosphate adenylyltransferase